MFSHGYNYQFWSSRLDYKRGGRGEEGGGGIGGDKDYKDPECWLWLSWWCRYPGEITVTCPLRVQFQSVVEGQGAEGEQEPARRVSKLF